MSLLRAVIVLIFLVTPSTCSIIYSEKYALYLGNFDHVFEVFRGLFFAFLLLAKRCAGDEDVEAGDFLNIFLRFLGF